jgi:hypothetical protein
VKGTAAANGVEPKLKNYWLIAEQRIIHDGICRANDPAKTGHPSLRP